MWDVIISEMDVLIRNAIRDELASKLETSDKMTKAEAAEYLGLKPSTLSKWITDGKGPKYLKAGSRVYYRKEWLDEYLDANTVSR